MEERAARVLERTEASNAVKSKAAQQLHRALESRAALQDELEETRALLDAERAKTATAVASAHGSYQGYVAGCH